MSGAAPTTPGSSLVDGCRRILERGDLEAKLAPVGASENDARGREAFHYDAPARAPGLRFRGGSSALPRPAQLRDPSARAHCLARFAHHELCAVELFAWALLRWPRLPGAMVRDLTHTLADEQTHCRLYLRRLKEHGGTLSEFPCADYIWRHCAVSVDPRAFLCAMGLTLEQANLDFSLRFAAAFREAGDTASAAVLERVHEDELRHVALAARWLRVLDPQARDDIARYEAAVPFPLSAARAKGRPFCAEARRRADLSEAFITHVRDARSNQELAGSKR